MSLAARYGTPAPVLLAETRQQSAEDVAFMGQALALARQAAEQGEVPVGAVVVDRGQLIGIGHNCPIAANDPTAHAEVIALRHAAQTQNNYRLGGATVYVTAEPCLMCLGAMLHARIGRIVFGCDEPKTGALGSSFDLRLAGRGWPAFEVSSGVCADQARQLLREFFRIRRGA